MYLCIWDRLQRTSSLRGGVENKSALHFSITFVRDFWLFNPLRDFLTYYEKKFLLRSLFVQYWVKKQK